MEYSMKQVCEQTGLSYDTLKFYCNEGLVPGLKRDEHNYRIFTEQNIEWIRNLTCLKNCGMSISEMKRYVELCRQGESTIPERRDILNTKLQNLRQEIERIEKNIDFIMYKLQFYEDVLNGKRKYYSNLAGVGE